MNFDLNDDQIAYVELAAQFSANELSPHAALWDAEAIFLKPRSSKQENWVFVAYTATQKWVGWACLD